MTVLDQWVQRLATQGMPFELLHHEPVYTRCVAISVQQQPRDVPYDFCLER